MVSELAVRVVAVWGGWSVQCDAVDHPLMFLSGAKAEAKAHDLARRLAVLGRTTRVTIHDRNHIPLVTALYFADESVDPTFSVSPAASRVIREPLSVAASAAGPIQSSHA